MRIEYPESIEYRLDSIYGERHRVNGPACISKKSHRWWSWWWYKHRYYGPQNATGWWFIKHKMVK